MNLRREVLDSMAIEYRTTRHVEEIKRLRERLATFDLDAEKAERIEQVLCKCCYYRDGRVVCHAYSTRQCASCDAVITSVNSDVDVLCVDCAERRGLCKRCGADINLKNRSNRPE